MQEAASARQVDLGEGLFVRPKSPSDAPRLIGSRCTTCGEVTFPKQQRCAHCASDTVQEITLGPRGTLYAFTNVNYPVPEGYKGPIPYGVGMIEMPEGVRVFAHLTESDPARLAIGMEMTLVIDRLFTQDDGSEVIGFKFKPVAP